MPSFPRESSGLLDRKSEGLDQLSASYTEAFQAVSQGDVEAAARRVEEAGEVLAGFEGWEMDPDSQEPGSPARQRLRAKAAAVLDLHSRLLDALCEEQAQTARAQKGLSQGKRHLESLQPAPSAGSILDSQG